MLPPIALNEHQRRHFEVVLSMLEDSLALIEDLGHPAPAERRTLTELHRDLPAGFAAGVAPLIAQARLRVRELAAAIGVTVRRQSAARIARSVLTAEIVRLQDSVAEKLRRYGAVASEAGAVLDPAVLKLEHDLRRIRDMLE